MWYINWFCAFYRKILPNNNNSNNKKKKHDCTPETRATKRKVNWSFTHLTGKLVFFRIFHCSTLSFSLSLFHACTPINTNPNICFHLSSWPKSSFSYTVRRKMYWQIHYLVFFFFNIKTRRKNFELVMCNKSKCKKIVFVFHSWNKYSCFLQLIISK